MRVSVLCCAVHLCVSLLSYSKALHITYKQGMNYLLAPLFFLQPLPLGGPGRVGVSSLYSALIARLLPNTFVDDEFGGLQCIFLLFRLLLLYHDPQLCTHLDTHDMGPELYASSWFLTLYANRCRLEVTLFLWDGLLLDSAEEPLLHYYLSLALLIANRAALLHESAVSLPELLSRLTIASKRDALTLLQRAKRLYRTNTPAVMRDKLREITAARIKVDSPLYAELSRWPASMVGAEEVIDALVHGEQPTSASPLPYFVLDCRRLEQYDSGHLPMSYHLDPVLLEERRAAELEERLEAVQALRGRHFCLADDGGANGESSAAAAAFLSLLLGRHVKFASLIRGGFAACHARVLCLERSSELIDHRPDDCLECNGRRAVRKEKRTLLSSMKKIGSAVMARYTSTAHAQRSNAGPRTRCRCAELC